MVDFFASQGPWPAADFDILGLIRRIPTPGDRLINLNQELEWFLPVRVGDRLGTRHEVWIESAEKGVTVPGSATVILPARR